MSRLRSSSISVLLMGYLWMAAALPAPAAEESPLTLADAVQIAVEHHPLLAAADARMSGSTARVRQAQAHKRVTLSAQAGYTRLDQDPSFSISPFGTLVFGEADNWTFNLQARYPLSTGGEVEAYLRQARAGVAATGQDRARTRQQVVLNVALAYLNALKARDMIQVAEEQRTALLAQRKSAKAMYEAGVAVKIDYLRAEVAVASAEEMLLRAKNGYATALAALNHAMGRDADAPIDLPEKTPALELPEELTLAQSRQLALQQRAEILALRFQEEAARAGIDAARSAKKPKVALFAQIDPKRPTFMPETGDWSVGLMVQTSVFDGGLSRAKAEEARSRRNEVLAMENEVRNAIQLQVTDAFLSYQSAQRRVETMRKALNQAEESLRLARVGYQNQVTPMTDVLAAQAELTRTRTDYLTAQYDREQARARLLFAMGALDLKAFQAKAGSASS